MFENIIRFFKNIGKKEEKSNETENSKDAAKERLHLVLMQDRGNNRSNKKIHRSRRRCNRCKTNK